MVIRFFDHKARVFIGEERFDSIPPVGTRLHVRWQYGAWYGVTPMVYEGVITELFLNTYASTQGRQDADALLDAGTGHVHLPWLVRADA